MIVINVGKWGRALLNFVQSFHEKREREEEISRQKEDFLQDIYQARADLEIARHNYNFAENSALLEYYIYEIKAAESRLDYCIRQAKAAGICRDFGVLKTAGGGGNFL